MVCWNKLLARTSFIIVFISITAISFAQTIDSSMLYNPVRDDIAKKLPPLEALIDSAIKHSPQIKLEELQADWTRYEITSARREWLRHWGLDMVANYGNYLYNDRDELTRLDRFYLSESRRLNYGAGVYVRIPVFYFVDRKNEINKKRKLLEIAIVNREVRVRDIRQMVIATFNTLMQQQHILRITNDYQQVADMMMRNAENAFLNGEIPPEEYARQKDYQVRGATDYALTIGRFNNAYTLLEELVGMRFNLINVLK
jgi:outer membrane protein TolC